MIPFFQHGDWKPRIVFVPARSNQTVTLGTRTFAKRLQSGKKVANKVANAFQTYWKPLKNGDFRVRVKEVLYH